MAKMLFTNNRTVAVKLTIEPWGLLETVQPCADVMFEFNDSPAPEVQFALEETGEPFVYVNSEYVRVTVGDKVQTHGYGKRAPSFARLKSDGQISN